jgi:hypothetical protein
LVVSQEFAPVFWLVLVGDEDVDLDVGAGEDWSAAVDVDWSAAVDWGEVLAVDWDGVLVVKLDGEVLRDALLGDLLD